MSKFPDVDKDKIAQIKETLGGGPKMFQSLSLFLVAASATAFAIKEVGKNYDKKSMANGILVVAGVAAVAVVVGGLMLVLSKFVGARKADAAAEVLKSSAMVIIAAGIAGLAASQIGKDVKNSELRKGIRTIRKISELIVVFAGLV